MNQSFLLIFLLIPQLLTAQNKTLRYNADGSFKIVQFTDVHYKKEDPNSMVAIQLIKEVLETEKPDLVVFTGDVIWAKPVKEGLDDVFNPVSEKKIPWTYIFGNHDDEFEISRKELMNYAQEKPYCLAVSGDKHLKGVGNYVLEINSRTGDSICNILYFMDSGAYSRLKEKGVNGYDWLDFSQIEWYRSNSKAYTAANQERPLPSLAFIHIPLPEYKQMAQDTTTVLIGNRNEKECSPWLNSGMFLSMLECGDVMGVFAGHDHDNDYIGSYHGIALAYGRYSGGKTVYNNLGKNGCRIITLQEGEPGFSSYIRLLGKEKIAEMHFPTSFVKKEIQSQ